ncbi:MAG TPA: hypothetical protein VK735_46305 [Pseudonocardia sp.]|jgi:hypothetical protein|uniref:hypothetical protein n=1 Tax=Pseudonocardia sp. TaxID=60912 RepID=UPI002CCE7C33|nr:hypothetical protein [Pseudonocardia sp.]HTF54903.1 hypothetical protein [Pseudonocardia sp.]
MGLRVKARHIPVRLSSGAFILGSGLDKRTADEQKAAQIHGFATAAYPMLKSIDPVSFVKLLSAGEIALGAALLLPVVPTLLAGLGLTAFSAGLFGLYLRVPGMHREGSLSPTDAGLPIAKDVWLLGSGLGLVLDALTDGKPSAKAATDPS